MKTILKNSKIAYIWGICRDQNNHADGNLHHLLHLNNLFDKINKSWTMTVDCHKIIRC